MTAQDGCACLQIPTGCQLGCLFACIVKLVQGNGGGSEEVPVAASDHTLMTEESGTGCIDATAAYRKRPRERKEGNAVVSRRRREVKTHPKSSNNAKVAETWSSVDRSPSPPSPNPPQLLKAADVSIAVRCTVVSLSH